MAKPLLGTTWNVTDATGESPFWVNDTIKITIPDDAKPTEVQVARTRSGSTTNFAGNLVSDKVKIEKASDEYWELLLSGEFNSKSTLYGIRWKDSGPDAMGSWVCDPQT